MKNLAFTLITLFTISNAQSQNIDSTLRDINDNLKNIHVSIIDWPDDLMQKLGSMKKSAFMAVSKKETTGKLPLLISLHGAGGKTWTIKEQLARSTKVKGLSLVELANKELILIEPNSFDDWDPKTLNVMLDYVLETFPQIDTNRVYVMGHSMGGKGAWYWILDSPNRFAAAAPCGFSNVSDDDDFSKLNNLPIWGMVGANDEKNVGPTKKMTERLKSVGNRNVKFTAFPGANHAKGNASVFSNVAWIEWMLTFKLNN